MNYLLFLLFTLAVVFGCHAIGIHAPCVTAAVVCASLFAAATATACGWLIFRRRAP